jgi:large subunit ribosomal protein L22
LSFAQRKAAGVISKLLKSALANASQDRSIDVDTLRIKEAFVDQGPMMKRFMPRARGRVTRIRKRTSHITLVLEES